MSRHGEQKRIPLRLSAENGAVINLCFGGYESAEEVCVFDKPKGTKRATVVPAVWLP